MIRRISHSVGVNGIGCTSGEISSFLDKHLVCHGLQVVSFLYAVPFAKSDFQLSAIVDEENDLCSATFRT